MKRIRAVWLLVASLMLLPATASAQVLFDTGIGQTNVSYLNRGVGQGVLVDAATDLTGFGFWMRSLGRSAPVDVRFMVWNGDHSTLLFTQVVQFSAFGDQNPSAVLLQTNPFSLALDAGSVYHFGMIVNDFHQPRTTLAMQEISDNGFTTQGPLHLYGDFNNPVRNGSGNTTLALQLQGTLRDQGPPASVPEPVTMLLLGTGLAGLAGVRRRHLADARGA